MSDHRLQQYIASAEGCYFIGKHHQRRIGVVADAIKKGVALLYHGDSIQALTGIDAQGYVTLVNGGRAWLSIDDVRQFWAFIVAGMGQHHVGNNVEVAYLQRYLCDHSGGTIPIRRDKHEHQIVFLDDDALAVTANQRSFKLYADELDQAHAWITTKRDEKSA